MPPLPVLTERQVLKVLKRHGFDEIRQSGSHRIMRHPDGRWTTVPIHKGRDIRRGTLKSIIDDAGLTVGDFTR